MIKHECKIEVRQKEGIFMNKPSIKFVQKYDNIPKTNVRRGQPLLIK